MDTKMIQNEIKEIMKVIDRICLENNITYMLSWGTALGAVRHQGFIPWDDDGDISMLYEEYLKFIEVCKKPGVLPEGFVLQTHEVNKNFPFLFAKLRNTNTEIKEHCFEGLGIQEGVWVDIFPAVNISKRKMIQNIQKKLLSVSNWLCHKYYFLNDNAFVREHHNHLKIKRFMFKHMPDVVVAKCVKFIMRVGQMKGNRESGYVADICESSEIFIMPKKFYKNCKKMPFEDTYLMVTEFYDEYLTQGYGDYMTPVKYSHGMLNKD